MIWWKIGGVLALAAALYGLFKYVEDLGYQRCKTEQQAANLKAITEYATRLKKAEEQRDENQTTIDRLAVQSRSVRVHLPVCANNGTAKDQNGGTGLAATRADEYMAEAKSAIDAIGERCAKLNADAIKVNATHP